MQINNPHDKFFKETFSKKKNVIDFIKSTFPKELVENLKLSTLKLDNNFYIDERLKENFTDTVYNCEYISEYQIKIVLLFEHKSKVIKYPHLQILHYMLNMWGVTIKQGQIPIPIIPIIFYHGKGKWKIRRLDEYFINIDDLLKKFIPDFNYILVDLSGYSNKELKQKLMSNFPLLTSLLLMKNIFNNKDLRSKLFDFLKEGKGYFEGEDGLKFINTITLYLLSTTDIEKDKIIKTITKVSKI